MIEIGEIERVKAFYEVSAYSQPLDSSDSILVAETGDDILAALRLCHEHGTLVLRAMRVHPDKLRRGIGTDLLRYAANVIGNEICYCIPYKYLTSFYSQIGFVEIPVDRAPKFLGNRLKLYQRKLNLDVILMEKAAC
jgi:N-acetylglutamate synthase-like GNAT family acetyltransferase